MIKKVNISHPCQKHMVLATHMSLVQGWQSLSMFIVGFKVLPTKNTQNIFNTIH